MKKSRCSDSQIMTLIQQTEAEPPAPELCREHGVSSATFY
jgi:putative transposase